MISSPLLAPRVAAKITLTDPPEGRPVIGPCWTYTGRLQVGGYGELTTKRLERSRLAHRYTYSLFLGPIPEGLHVDHLCRNRACCNPCHLEAVTNHVNHLRGERANRTHCKRAGHELSGRNLIVKNGEFGPRRECRACKYDSQRSSVARRQGVVLPEGDSRHGITGYGTYQCRCDICRQAGSDSNRRAAQRRAARRQLAVAA